MSPGTRGVPSSQRATVTVGSEASRAPISRFFRGVEGVELVDKDGPVPQELRQFAPGQCGLEAGCGQLQPVGGVHACPGQQGLVALKDEGQFAEFGAVGAAVLRQLIELLARETRALELVDGLGGHLAEGGRAAVAVIVMDVVLQFLEGAAHQHGTACVREGLHRRAALGGKDLFCQTGKRKTLHHTGQGIPQLTVDAALGAGSELFRHQQDAFSPFSARARMRWYSSVVFPLPEPPRSSCNIVFLTFYNELTLSVKACGFASSPEGRAFGISGQPCAMDNN